MWLDTVNDVKCENYQRSSRAVSAFEKEEDEEENSCEFAKLWIAWSEHNEPMFIPMAYVHNLIYTKPYIPFCRRLFFCLVLLSFCISFVVTFASDAAVEDLTDN